MAGIIISTGAFFVAIYFIRRYLDDLGIPKEFTCAVVVFVIAAIISYAVALKLLRTLAFQLKIGQYIC